MDDPPSLHRYFYANANPLRYVDPTGHGSEPGKKVYVCDSGGCRGEVQQAAAPADGGKPQAVASDIEAEYPAWLKEELAASRKRRLEKGLPADELESSENPKEVVTEDLGAESSGDPATDAILKQRKDTKAALRNVGKYGRRAGEEALSLGSGTAGDIATAATGVDPATGEEVGTAGRILAVAGVVLPGVSGHDLRGAKRLAQEIQAARRLTRTAPGVAHGGGELASAASRWLRGSHGNAGAVPKDIADQLRGKTFRDFDHFREEFWKAAAGTPHLANQFSPQNVGRMRQGMAPRTVPSQHLGDQMSYILHHKTPVQQGGGVYDLDNIMVVTPRYHKEALDPSLHYKQ